MALRDEFEEWLAEYLTNHGHPHTAGELKNMRNGPDRYQGIRPFWDGAWAGWQARKTIN